MIDASEAKELALGDKDFKTRLYHTIWSAANAGLTSIVVDIGEEEFENINILEECATRGYRITLKHDWMRQTYQVEIRWD